MNLRDRAIRQHADQAVRGLNLSKLVKVYCTIKGAKFIYRGLFENGTQRQLRTSARCYVSVAQTLHNYGSGYREEILFSAKPTVKLDRRKTLLAEVQIGLDTAES